MKGSQMWKVDLLQSEEAVVSGSAGGVELTRSRRLTASRWKQQERKKIAGRLLLAVIFSFFASLWMLNVYLLKGFRGGRRQAALRRWHRRHHHHHQHPLLSERPLPPSSTASSLEGTLTVSWTEPQSTSPPPLQMFPFLQPFDCLLSASEWSDWWVRSPRNNAGGGGGGGEEEEAAAASSSSIQWLPNVCEFIFVQLIGDDLCLSGWDPCQARGRGSIWQKWRWERNSVFDFASHLPSRFRLCVSLRFYVKLIKYETFVFPFYSHCEGPTNTKFLFAI